MLASLIMSRSELNVWVNPAVFGEMHRSIIVVRNIGSGCQASLNTCE